MSGGDRVCFADDRHNGGLAQHGLQDLKVEILVQDTNNRGIRALGLSIGRPFSGSNILVQTHGIKNQEGAVDVGVSDAWRANHLHFLAQGFFELALQEVGYSTELDVHNVPLQALGVPQGQPYPFSIEIGFQVVRSEAIVRARVPLNFLKFFRQTRGMLVGWHGQRLAEEVEERGLS